MAFYTICGKPDCINFAHATYVAQYLFEHLPNFKYNKVEKPSSQWSHFLANLNKKNKWYVVRSPVIWKEISAWGGKPYLIGGLGEFWEYCYCYYGLQSTISKVDLQKLAGDNAKFYKEEQEKHLKDRRTFNVVISIFGGNRNPLMTENVLEVLLAVPELSKDNGFFVKLYDDDFDTAEVDQERKYMETAVTRYNDLATFGDRKVIEIVDNEDEAITNTDLLFILENYSRQEGEDYQLWIKRCYSRMEVLSETIKVNGKRSLKVIFCNEGPVCLMATLMVEQCLILEASHIVVLTADRGLPVIRAISQMTGVPVSKIGAPPVWGFVGLNEYVDEANILFKANIFRPYARAATAPEGSTIPLGTVVPELRLISYLVPNQHDDIMKLVEERRAIIEAKLFRKPFLQKIRALHSLLKIWYADEISDEIISLGLVSTGSYDIPCGMVFSQPCILDKKRRWRPFPNFPLMNDATNSALEKLIEESKKILEEVCCVKSVSDDRARTSKDDSNLSPRSPYEDNNNLPPRSSHEENNNLPSRSFHEDEDNNNLPPRSSHEDNNNLPPRSSHEDNNNLPSRSFHEDNNNLPSRSSHEDNNNLPPRSSHEENNNLPSRSFHEDEDNNNLPPRSSHEDNNNLPPRSSHEDNNNLPSRSFQEDNNNLPSRSSHEDNNNLPPRSSHEDNNNLPPSSSHDIDKELIESHAEIESPVNT